MLLTRKVAGASASTRKSVCARAATTLPKQFTGIKPVGDRVLVSVDAEEVRTAAGLLLPGNSRNKPNTGSIVAAGDSKTISQADSVVYSKFAGTEVEVGGKEHVLLKEEDVIGVLSSGKKIATLKPLSDRVLIKMAAVEGKTSGGVLLNVENAEKPTFGTVVAVGPGKKDPDSGEVSAPNITVGSTVLYSKYSGTEFEEDSSNFIVVRESDILAQLS